MAPRRWNRPRRWNLALDSRMLVADLPLRMPSGKLYLPPTIASAVSIKRRDAMRNYFTIAVLSVLCIAAFTESASAQIFRRVWNRRGCSTSPIVVGAFRGRPPAFCQTRNNRDGGSRCARGSHATNRWAISRFLGRDRRGRRPNASGLASRRIGNSS